jgi:hypothetical protein
VSVDPWELLRQARNELDVLASYVGHPDTKWPTVGLMMTAVAQKKLRDHIEVALAEHESAKDDVEWAEGPFGVSQVATVNGWELDVGYVWVSPTKSEWRVSLQRAGESKEELMTTATRVARGLR